MIRRVARVVMVLSIVLGVSVVFTPAARATKILETWKGSTSELKSECGDQGGTYMGSPSGKIGICVWGDGSMSTCNDKRKGKNCNTQGRIVTEDDEFLDFVKIGLADPSSLTVTPGDDTPADGRRPIRRLLRGEDFEMAAGDLEATCTDASADVITRDGDARAICLGGFFTIFCDTQQDGDNCAIEGVKKSTRRWLKLLRRALTDPSSVEIVVSSVDSTPPPTAGQHEPSTTTTTTTPTTEPSTTSTSQEPAFL